MTKNISLEEAHRALISAKADYDARVADANAARLAETKALNELNRLQKAFDDATAEIRKSLGSIQSNWGRRKPEWKSAEV